MPIGYSEDEEFDKLPPPNLRQPQPPSRDEIAEQAIDFIENLGYPLVPWQAEMLRHMLKHDGPVEVYPQPRKHSRPPHCSATASTDTHHTHRCMAHVVGPDGSALHLCQCAHAWIADIEPKCLCTMGYSSHCPVHGQQAMQPPRPGMVRVQRDGKWVWSDLFVVDEQDD